MLILSQLGGEHKRQHNVAVFNYIRVIDGILQK